VRGIAPPPWAGRPASIAPPEGRPPGRWIVQPRDPEGRGAERGAERRVETRRWNIGKSAFADCGVGFRAAAIARFVVERGRLPAERRRALEDTRAHRDA